LRPLTQLPRLLSLSVHYFILGNKRIALPASAVTLLSPRAVRGNMTDLKDLDVSTSMKETVRLINVALDSLNGNALAGKPSTLSPAEKGTVDVVKKKLLEVEEAFWRPLDSPETFERLAKVAASIGDGDLIKYCQKQKNMVIGTEIHFKGYCQLFYGNAKEAVGHLKKAVELAPDLDVAPKDYETAVKRVAKAEKDLPALNRMMSTKGETAELLQKKAVALMALGNVHEAIPLFDRVIKLDPANPDAWGKRGTALESLGKFDEAVPYLSKALQLKPTSITAKRGLGLATYWTKGGEKPVD
jgi:tetratricopeptide (TPR) repeat protein